MELKVGTILVAKVKCKMNDGSGNALKIGKEYPIIHIDDSELMISSESIESHYFDIRESEPAYYGRFFAVKNEDSQVILSTEKYWKERCLLAEKCLSESPCDPDITSGQIEAHSAYNSFLKTFKLS